MSCKCVDSFCHRRSADWLQDHRCVKLQKVNAEHYSKKFVTTFRAKFMKVINVDKMTNAFINLFGKRCKRLAYITSVVKAVSEMIQTLWVGHSYKLYSLTYSACFLQFLISFSIHAACSLLSVKIISGRIALRIVSADMSMYITRWFNASGCTTFDVKDVEHEVPSSNLDRSTYIYIYPRKKSAII